MLHSSSNRSHRSSVARVLCKRLPRTMPMGRSNPVRLYLEPLEDRTAPAIFTVTNSLDDGSTGSLRWAIMKANADTDPLSTINFSIRSGLQTIQVGASGAYSGQTLPSINHPVLIDGTTQSGYAGVPIIVLDGSNAQNGASSLDSGLDITATAAGSTVKGLVIEHFSGTPSYGRWSEIRIDGGGNNVIASNYIGLDPSGSIADTSGGLAIFIIDSSGNTIGGSAPGAGNVMDEEGSGWATLEIVGTGVGAAPAANYNVVQGNYIGLNPAGTQRLVNDGGSVGIFLLHNANFNTIGGTAVGARNVIAGYGGGAVWLEGHSAGTTPTQNAIEGNYIGTNAAGTVGLGISDESGVTFQFEGDIGATDDVIGGTDPGAGNLISGEPGYAVLLENGLGDQVEGNLIGTDYTGTQRLTSGTANGTAIAVPEERGVVIGGTAPGAGNTIAFNNGPSISVGCTGVRIEGNSIYANSGLGIDLVGNGVPLLNDSPLGHSGANNYQNFPILDSATSSSAGTLVTGTFSEAAEPNTTLTFDFYANTAPDPSGYGQGQTYLGSCRVRTDANGNLVSSPDGSAVINADDSFMVTLPTPVLVGEGYLSATATDEPNGAFGPLGGDTSEFSPDLAVPGPNLAPVTSQNLQALLNSLVPAGAAPAAALAAADSNQADAVLTAVNGLAAQATPVTVTLDLASGAYTDITASPPKGVTLVIVGNGTTTTIVGQSPALTLTSGNVIVTGVTFTTATDAPTILVTGGSLTLRNDIIQESTGFTDAAISITGGTLDLGTTRSPGGNTINVNGTGQFVQNTTPNSVSAVGDTFESNGTILPAPTLSFASLTASVNPSTLNQSVTLTASVRSNGSSTTPTGRVDFFDTTTSTDLGSVALSGGSASLTTSALAAGNHVIRATYSGDTTFLPSLAVLTQQVHYTFSGFLPPLNQGLAFGIGRTVPIKFQLTDYNKSFIRSLSAVTGLQVVYPDNSTHAISGLRYDPTANQFVANWQTKGLSAGNYTISLTLADGTSYAIKVSLSKAGSSSGLTTMAAGGTGSAPGGLLGGNIDIYVDNSNGNLTADELVCVQDAVTAVDAVTVPYGVAVTEVTDPTQADVTLNMDTTSAVGGYVSGVLGCTTDAGQITIIAGWNFYAGSDATQIGSGQYDFETVVTHEMGHALGLGHSANSASVMFATLNAGTANRALAVADLNVPDSDTGGACGLHADQAPGTGFSFDSFYPPLQPSPTRGEGESWKQPVNGQQAALNAILADWNLTMDFASQAAHILDVGQNKGPLRGAGLLGIKEQDDLWSSISGSTLPDSIGELTMEFRRNYGSG